MGCGVVYELCVEHAATRAGVDGSCWDRYDLAVIHAELIDQDADAVVVGGDDADHRATSSFSTSLDCLVVVVVVVVVQLQMQMPPSGPAGQVSTWLLLVLTVWSSSWWWA